MRASYQEIRNGIRMDSEISKLRCLFEEIEDKRASNCSHKLEDILMSGFAMFLLKHPSLLSFEEQNEVEKVNIKNVFGIPKLCSDAQLRKVLDDVNPDFLRVEFSKKFKLLERAGFVKEYSYKSRFKKVLNSF